MIYTSHCCLCPICAICMSTSFAMVSLCSAWSSVSIQCVIKHKRYHVVCFRFTSRCHPRCSAGGCSDLCPAGRDDVVCVQEERFTLSEASHSRQRLLQTNQLSGYRVRWQCADHRPGRSLRRVALNASWSFFLRSLLLHRVLCPSLTTSPSSLTATWHCKL